MDFFPRGSVLGMTGMLDFCSLPLNLATGTVWSNAMNYRCCSGLGCMNVVILFLNNIINKVCLLFNWVPGQATRTSLQAQGFPLECDVAVLAELFAGEESPQQPGSTYPSLVFNPSHGPTAPAWLSLTGLIWAPKASGSFPVALACFALGPCWKFGETAPQLLSLPKQGQQFHRTPFWFCLVISVAQTSFVCGCLAGTIIDPSLMWAIKPFVQIWLFSFR